METWTRLVKFSRQRVVSREESPPRARQGDKRFTSPSSSHLCIRGIPILRDRDREAQQLGTRGSGVKYLAPIRTNAVAALSTSSKEKLDPEAILHESEASVFGKDGTAVFASFHPRTPNWIFP